MDLPTWLNLVAVPLLAKVCLVGMFPPSAYDKVVHWDEAMQQAGGARVAITYCTQCNWLLRAAWMAQELLQTFGTELREVALVPGTGGIFTIDVDESRIWDRRRDGGFPDVKTLKGRVRDLIDPERDLGHIDRHRADDDVFFFGGEISHAGASRSAAAGASAKARRGCRAASGFRRGPSPPASAPAGS